MRYTSVDGRPRLGPKKNEDIGIDLPSAEAKVVWSGSYSIIDTGIIFEFPLFSKLRRMIFRLLFGHDVIGIGGLIKPRGRHNHLIMSGVVDAGYRGTIKVKIYNPHSDRLTISPGDLIAQLVPIFSINTQPRFSKRIDLKTQRGDTGGINSVRRDGGSA